MAEPRGFTVTDGLLGLDRVKVWMLPGLLGNVVFWEWRYFQTLLKVSDAWPKEQRHNGTLCTMSEKFELPSDSFCFPKDFGVGKGWLVSTRGLVALFSSISSRPGPRKRARRDLALAFSRSFVTLAAGVIEEMAAHEKVDLKILGVPITVSGRGRLPGLERVAHRRPELVEAWDRLAPRCGLPAFDTCDLVHLWRFAEGVTVTRHSCIMPGIVEWASSMVVGLSRLVAFCIEKKVDQSCRAEHRVEPPRPLFGPKGSRRNVDEVERLEQFRKARKAKGCQNSDAIDNVKGKIQNKEEGNQRHGRQREGQDSCARPIPHRSPWSTTPSLRRLMKLAESGKPPPPSLRPSRQLWPIKEEGNLRNMAFFLQCAWRPPRASRIAAGALRMETSSCRAESQLVPCAWRHSWCPAHRTVGSHRVAAGALRMETSTHFAHR